MNDLIAELEEAARPRSNAPGACSVCRMVEDASEEVRPSIVGALAGKIGERRLAEILTRNGHPVSSSAIGIHRRKGHTSS